MNTRTENNYSIFEFEDYRLFLNSIFISLKTKKKRISLESFARKLGISKSYLRYIFEAKRHVTLDLVPKIVKAFQFDRATHQALIYSICRETCQDPETKSFFQGVLTSLQDPGVDRYVNEPVQKERAKGLFENWLSMIIHSLAKQSGFQNDVAWIKERLLEKNVSLKDIESSLRYLIQSKSIVQNDEGAWKAAAFVFNNPDTDVLNGFQVYQVGLRAMESVTNTPENFKPVSFQMMTLSFDEENVDQISTIIRNCRDSLIKVSQSSVSPTRVVFINLNSACVAKAPTGEPKK